MAKLVIAIIITAALVVCLFACVPCEKEDNTACIAEVEDDVCVTVTFSADNADISVFHTVAPVKCAPVTVADTSVQKQEQNVCIPGVRDFKNVIKQ